MLRMLKSVDSEQLSVRHMVETTTKPPTPEAIAELKKTNKARYKEICHIILLLYI